MVMMYFIQFSIGIDKSNKSAIAPSHTLLNDVYHSFTHTLLHNKLEIWFLLFEYIILLKTFLCNCLNNIDNPGKKASDL